ncbi:MAG: DNA polymerase I [Spirochaetota bacterium]
MKKPLYLLDGYGLIYRTYFAFLRKPLINSKGKNVSVIYGFFRTLLSLFEAQKPVFFAVAMDSITPTFRHELYPAYKATREKAPEELHAQIPIVEEVLSALGIPILRINGYEADDIISTLAENCKKEKRGCFIISGDKDLLQLVEGEIRVLKPEKGDYKVLGRDEVFAEYSVYPDQIIDYLALTGDASDNIPGVKGIGPKTASGLLAKFQTLEGIYQSLDEIPLSQQKKLREAKENALLSRRLVILNRNVPLGVDFEALGLKNLGREAAAQILLREDIKSIAQELLSKSDSVISVEDLTEKMPSTEENKKGTYRSILTLQELDEWMKLIKKHTWFAFDVETDGLDAVTASPVGFSLAVQSGEGCYVPIKASGVRLIPEPEIKARLTSMLTDKSLKLIGQNIKYDYMIMKRWGIEISNIAFDTMIAAWLLDSQLGAYNMDKLAERFLNYKTIHFDEVVPKGSTFDTVPLKEATEYSAEDADITFRLYKVFSPRIKSENMEDLFYNVEMPLVAVLGDMELEGIRILSDKLDEYGKELSVKLKGIEDEIYKLCGQTFNISSTKQLQEILFTVRKLKPVKKTKTGLSTDTSVLEELSSEDPVAGLVLKHRLLSKLKSTYVDALPKLINPYTGKIHTHYIQTGTATGRLSSRDPNLQNIPIRDEEGRRIRSAFVPNRGNLFLSADYSQIELVVFAHLSKDPALSDAFQKGKDVHKQTAALIFDIPEDEVTQEQRRAAKIINFGVMYGMSAFRLARELGIPRGKADAFINSYFAKYYLVRKFIEETVQQAEKSGTVPTLLGRVRKVIGINSKNKTEKMAAERVAVNTPIQGTAADIVKTAMIRVTEVLKKARFKARLILQVHDELIFEVPVDEVDTVKRIVQKEMESAVTLRVPLKVSIETGSSWGDLH